MRRQLSIPIVIVIIVIMSSVARHAAVSHTHFKRTLKPEGQDRIARNPYRPPRAWPPLMAPTIAPTRLLSRADST